MNPPHVCNNGCICILPSLSFCVLDNVQSLGVRQHFKEISTHDPQSDLIYPEQNWLRYFRKWATKWSHCDPFLLCLVVCICPFSLLADASLSPNPPKTVRALMAISASTGWGFTLAAPNHEHAIIPSGPRGCAEYMGCVF